MSWVWEKTVNGEHKGKCGEYKAFVRKTPSLDLGGRTWQAEITHPEFATLKIDGFATDSEAKMVAEQEVENHKNEVANVPPEA